MSKVTTIIVIFLLIVGVLWWWRSTQSAVVDSVPATESAPVQHYNKLFDSVEQAQDINEAGQQRATEVNDILNQ